MTSRGLWTAGVHVNMANVGFPNGSGSAQPGVSGPPEPGCLFPHLFPPSDCLCICFRSVQSVRCVCVCVRSGSFKHCSKSIALIKGITSQKREKKTQAALRSSVKLEKSELYKANVCHIANDNTVERLLEQQQKENHTDRRKERVLRFHNLTSFLSVPC